MSLSVGRKLRLDRCHITKDSSTDRVRILVCDDHAMVREGLRRLLEQQGFDIIGEASDGRQAVERTLKLRPDVVLMDLAMPILGGREATEQITLQMPGVRVVIVTHGEGPSMAEDAIVAIRDRAHGLVLKDAGAEELSSAISKVMSGNTYISESALEAVRCQVGRVEEEARTRTVDASVDVLSQTNLSLSADEITILSLLKRGEGDEAIAARLFVSLSTAKRKVQRLREKFGNAANRTELVRRAADLGLPPDRGEP